MGAGVWNLGEGSTKWGCLEQDVLRNFAEALKTNTTVKRLDFDYSYIEVDGAIAVAEAMKFNNTITSLNSIGPAGAIAVAEALKINKAITVLILDDNSIGDAGAIAVAEAMKINNTITRLNLKNNSIRDAGAIALAKAMEINQTITVLSLDGNCIRADGAIALAEAMKIIDKAITVINLGSIHFGDAGTIIVAEAMKFNNTITSLDLSRNSIGDAGAVAVAGAIKINSTITHLDLCGNFIGYAAARTVAAAMAINHTITNLCLGGNAIEAAGAIAVAEAMKINNTITHLDLSSNSIGTANSIALAVGGAIAINKSITHLDLSCNPIGDFGAIAMAEAMKINNTITRLDLRKISLGVTGAIAMADAMKINKTITHLDVSDNSIGAAGSIAIAEAMKYSNSITRLEGVELNQHLRLLELPEDLYRYNNKSILIYLKEIKQSSRPIILFRMRVMLVGPGEAGKTTLVHRILTDEFQPVQLSRTDGIAMKEWSPSMIDQNSRTSISLWDFGGQEVYLNSHPIFFSERTLYVLVWNPLAGTSRSTLEQYAVNIRSRTKTAPIMLVTTHSDEVTIADNDECVQAMKDICSVSYKCTRDTYGSLVASNFPLDNHTSGINGEADGCLKEISSTWTIIDGDVDVVWKHFPLDSKKGVGLKEFKESLLQFTKAYSPFVLIPAWYNSLELKLREFSVSRFSLDRDEFRSICHACWSDAPNSNAEANHRIKTILYLFHHWGVIYLLPDPSDPNCDILDGNGDIILNPQDMADVFKDVITCTTRPCLEFGVLFHDQEQDIWSRFDAKLHPQFLTLFYNFELAYEVFDSEGNSSGRSLIPSLLPELPTPVHHMCEDDLREKMFGVWESKSDPALKMSNHMISRGYVKIMFDCLLPNFFPKLLVRLRHMSSSSVSDCSRHHCVVHHPERELGSLTGRVIGWSVCCVVEDRDSSNLFVYPGGCSFNALSIAHEAVYGLLNESFATMALVGMEVIIEGISYTVDQLHNSLGAPGQEFLASLILFHKCLPTNASPNTNTGLLSLNDFAQNPVTVLTVGDRIQLYKSLLSSIGIFRSDGLKLPAHPEILWLVGKSTHGYFLYPVSPSLSPTETWSIIWNSKIPFDLDGQSLLQSQLSHELLRLLPLMFSHHTLPFAKDDVEWIGIPSLCKLDCEIVRTLSWTVPAGFHMVRNLCGQSVYHYKQKFNGLDEAIYEIASANEQRLHLHLSSQLVCIDILELKKTLMKCQRRIGKDYWHTFISAKQVIREEISLDRVALLQLAMLKDPRIEDHWKRKILFGLLISQGLTIVKEAETIVAPIPESNLESALVKLSFQLGHGFQPKVQFLCSEQQCEHRSLKPPDLLFFCEERNIVEELLISDLVKHILRGLANLSEEDHLLSPFRLKSVSSVMNKLFYRGKDLSDLFAATAKNIQEFQDLITSVRRIGSNFYNRSTNGNGCEVLKYYRMLQVDISAIKADGRSYNPLLFPVFYEIVLLTSNDRAPHEVYELKRLRCTLFEKFESSLEVRDLLTRRNISFEHPAVPHEELFDGEEEKGN